MFFFFFFFNDTATTEIYTLSLHDALPISIAVPDPALRERVLAPAGARLGVEFVKRDGSLLRRQLGQIDTGKLHGAVSVLQENLSGIVERFHFHIANRQTEQRPNLHF